MKKTFLTLFVLLTAVVTNADNVTLSAYIYPYTLTPNAPIVLSTTDAENWSDGVGLYLDDDGKASAFIAGETDTAILQGIIPPLEAWSHLALVIDGDTSSFYINNLLQDSAEITPASIPEGDLIVADDGYTAFNGEIRLDEASITEDADETELKVESGELEAAAQDGTPPNASAYILNSSSIQDPTGGLPSPATACAEPQLNSQHSTLNSLPNSELGSASTLNTSTMPLFVIHSRLE